MKILIFTDVHGDSEIISRLLLKVKKEKPDAIICAGDITNFGFGIKSILKRLDSVNIPLFIIPGNHETDEEIVIYGQGMKNIQSIHLKPAMFHSLYIVGCGGGGFTQQHAEFEMSEKKFADSMKKVKMKDHKYKTILVTHQPPYKTLLDLVYGDHSGSTSIRKFIQQHQPDYCITGHIHENEGKQDKIGKTIIINPGPLGKIIEI
ncbi:MAG: metallophosphoesterase [Nanoarchaeota archaeon]|nr:metallophosphoesterase [Nanoarchaeota archaeon]